MSSTPPESDRPTDSGLGYRVTRTRNTDIHEIAIIEDRLIRCLMQNLGKTDCDAPIFPVHRDWLGYFGLMLTLIPLTTWDTDLLHLPPVFWHTAFGVALVLSAFRFVREIAKQANNAATINTIMADIKAERVKDEAATATSDPKAASELVTVEPKSPKGVSVLLVETGASEKRREAGGKQPPATSNDA